MFLLFFGVWYRICATKVLRRMVQIYGIITGMAEDFLNQEQDRVSLQKFLAELFFD